MEQETALKPGSVNVRDLRGFLKSEVSGLRYAFRAGSDH